MSALKSRAANAAMWSSVEIAARYGVQFVVMVVMARLLLPSDFGLIAMLLVFTSIGALFVDSGFGNALIQRQNNTPDDETTAFIFNIGAGVVMAVALLLLAPAIAYFFDQPELTELTRVIAVVLPLGALAAVPDALLTMKLNFKARAGAELIASLCSGFAGIALALQDFGAWSLAWQSIIAITIRCVLLWRFSGWRPRGRYSSESFLTLFGFGGYLLLTGLLNTIAVRIQTVLIGKLFDVRQLGYYTLAQNTQQAPASLMGSLLNRLGLPIFSTIAHDHQRLVEALRTSLRMSMFLFVPCMVGVALVAKPLIAFLYGEDWMPAAPILSILALSSALWPIHVLNLAAISSLGKSKLLLRIEVIKQFATIGMIAGATPWGPTGIAWAVFFGSLLAVIVNTYYSMKLLGYGIFSQLVEQSSTFFLSAAAAIIAWAVMHWTAPGTATMIIAIFSAALTYLLLAFLTRNVALSSLLSVLGALREPQLPHQQE